MKDTELIKSDIYSTIEYLYANDQKELKQLCNKAMKKFGGLSQKDYDCFYSRAGYDISVSIQSYDPSKEKSFLDYVSGVIKFSVLKEMNYRNSAKRQLIVEKEELDSDGQIVKKKEYISNVSIDAPIGDESGLTIGDTLMSDFNMEEYAVSTLTNEFDDEKINELFNSMTKTQKKIIDLKLNSVSVSEIKGKLGLSNQEYSDIMKNIKENINWKHFKKRSIKRGGNLKMENVKSKQKENIISIEIVNNVIPLEYANNVIPLDLSDNYRMDKIPLKNLIDDMNSNKINRNYILQREACQWTPRQINKYLTRVLNSQPIPEIVICEQNVNGKKRSHLIDGLQRLSYSSLFMSDKITIGADGAEFYYIPYKEYLFDDDGNTILDEEGDAKFVLKLFNAIGKKFSEFPDYIKSRFEKFNINVTTYFNCTDAQIAYHIRNYNNQEGMNKNQYEFTGMDIKIAEKVKKISKKHPFFNDCCGKYTNKNKTKGEVDRVVIESLMTINFLDNWKKEVKDSFSYVNENVSEEMFISLTDTLDRLYCIIDKDVKDVFTTTNSSIWFAVFEKFKKLGVPDIKFKDFILYIKSSMDKLLFNEKPFIEIYKNKSARDKKIVSGKINGLLKFMKDFFNIVDSKENITDEASFIMDIFDMTVEEYNSDIDLYKETLNSLTSKSIHDGSKLLDAQNKLSLLALVIYSFKKDADLDEWLTEYSNKHDDYLINQKDNYLHMKEDFEQYIKNRRN